MKILAVYEKKEDALVLEHHLKSAILEIGLINIKTESTTEIPTDDSVANVFVMNRDLASKVKLSNIVIIEDVLDYKEIKEKLERLFTVYGILTS